MAPRLLHSPLLSPPTLQKSSSALLHNETVVRPSPLESLPRDVLWMIMDHARLSAFKLKLTSSTMKSRVDEYTLLSIRDTKRFVEKLHLVETCNHDSERTMNIQLFVPIRLSMAFDVLMLADPTLNLVDRMVRSQFGHTAIKYGIDVEMSKDGMAVLEHIRECIGTEVREVTIRECCERDSMEYFEVFASEINFEGLQFTVSTLTEEIANKLTRSIGNNYVKWLSLTVRDVEVNDPERLLLDLSTLVRALQIHQKETKKSRDTNYFFGLFYEGLVPIIFKMFSGKLDKLSIHNTSHIGYLSLASAELLRKQLPWVGKRIWFDATCVAYARDVASVANDHFVHGNLSNSDRWRPTLANRRMTIKHKSRANETFEI